MTQYHDAIRAFIIADPDSKDGMDLGLEEVNPGHKWDMLEAKNLADLNRETADLARENIWWLAPKRICKARARCAESLRGITGSVP